MFDAHFRVEFRVPPCHSLLPNAAPILPVEPPPATITTFAWPFVSPSASDLLPSEAAYLRAAPRAGNPTNEFTPLQLQKDVSNNQRQQSTETGK